MDGECLQQKEGRLKTIGDLAGTPHGKRSIVTEHTLIFRFLSNVITHHESNNEGEKKKPIKSDCVSLPSSISGGFIQQLGPVERNLRGLICVEYQFNAQMHF